MTNGSPRPEIVARCRMRPRRHADVEPTKNRKGRLDKSHAGVDRAAIPLPDGRLSGGMESIDFLLVMPRWHGQESAAARLFMPSIWQGEVR